MLVKRDSVSSGLNLYHAIINLEGCKESETSEVNEVKTRLYDIVKKSGMNAVGEKFHQFKPSGVTGIILLSESHISVHTWPEKRFIAMDIFSCAGRKKAEAAIESAIECFTHERYKRKIIKR